MAFVVVATIVTEECSILVCKEVLLLRKSTIANTN